MPGLSKGTIETLPLPINAAEFFALLHQQRPQPPDHATLDPPLKRAVDAGVVAELSGQVVPLHAAAQAVNDAVQGLALVDPIRTEPRRRIVLFQHLGDPRPKCVVDFPDRRQRLGLFLPSRHPWLLSSA